MFVMVENEFEGEISDNESDVSLCGESECEGEDSGGEDVCELVMEMILDDWIVILKKGKVKKKKKK